MGTLFFLSLGAWVAVLVVSVLVIAGIHERDPIEGIRRCHLWILGVLVWPIIFAGGWFAMAWLLPESICDGSGDWSAALNCVVGWALAILVMAAVIASLAVFLFVKRVHARQEDALTTRKRVN